MLFTTMKTLLCFSLLIALSAPARAAEKKLARELLGLRLSMNEEQAHERLSAIGKLTRREEMQQEVWTVRDPSYSHLIVGFGRQERVRYLTAVARTDKGAKHVLYSQVGPLKGARQTGDVKTKNFKYVWDLPADKDEPRTMLLAMGRDPKFLSTLTLKNLQARRALERD